MSAGMADIVAAHGGHSVKLSPQGSFTVQCHGCGRSTPVGEGKLPRSGAPIHAAHVAEELTKAGYGLLPDVAPEYGARTMLFNGLSEEPEPHGPNPKTSWFTKSTHVRLVGPWQELQSLPDPLAAALNDPEGHALVQAIHDRKAGQ